MPRCRIRCPSPQSTSRYFPRRRIDLMVRPASRRTAGGTGQRNRGSRISTPEMTRPEICGKSPRRVTSTSGSSGIQSASLCRAPNIPKMGRSQMPKYIFAAVLSLAACAATPQSAPEELNEPTLYDFLLGEIALQRGDVTLAAKTYLELAKHTRDPRVARRAVEVANLARLPDLAIEAAQAAARSAAALRPEWEPPAVLEAQVLQKRSPAAAAKRLEAFVAKNPGSREGRLNYARALVLDKRFPEARKQFEALLAANPGNTDVIYAVGLLAYQLKDYPVAEENMKRLLGLGYRDPNGVRYLLGQIAEEQKAWPRAIEWYEQIVSGEHVVPARLRAASAIAKQGKLDEARAYLKRAAEDNPDQEVQLIVAEAQLLREANHSRDAFELLGQALRKDPEQPDLLYDMALTAEKLERYEQMESNLRKLIEVQPEYAHAYNALGYSFAERNTRLAEARKLIEKALELSPEDYFIIDSLGWVLYREGNLKGAAEQLRRAYSGRPDAEIGAHLGEVLWVMGRRDEAERIWQESIKSAPENDTLQKTIKRLKR